MENSSNNITHKIRSDYNNNYVDDDDYDDDAFTCTLNHLWRHTYIRKSSESLERKKERNCSKYLNNKKIKMFSFKVLQNIRKLGNEFYLYSLQISLYNASTAVLFGTWSKAQVQ